MHLIHIFLFNAIIAISFLLCQLISTVIRHSTSIYDILKIISDDATTLDKFCYKNDNLKYQNLCDCYSDGVNIHNYHQLEDRHCRIIERSCQIHSCSVAIDIVVLWVNYDDQMLQKSLNATLDSINMIGYHTLESTSNKRFRDLKQLKYLLRSVEKYGKQWARRIFLVTNNQVPDYVNMSHPRIRLVTHQELFKYANVAPPKYSLFNSIAIQSMIHNIPTLSSPFYLFDDDVSIIKDLPVTIFTDGNRSIIDLDTSKHDIRDKPQTLYENHIQSAINMALRTNRSVQLLGGNGEFLIAAHAPLLLYREIGTKIWMNFQKEMNILISHPFRMPTDPSIQTLYIYMGYVDYYTFLTGRKLVKFEMLNYHNPRVIRNTLAEAFADKSAYFLCVNDDLESSNEEIQICITEAYETIFPNRSSFEY